MTNPASFDDQHVHIFVFNAAPESLSDSTHATWQAALNLSPDWRGQITPIETAQLAELDCSAIQQHLQPDSRLAVFVNADNIFCRHWLPRLLAGLSGQPHAVLCSALTTRVFALSPLPEGLRFEHAFQSLDNALYLRNQAIVSVPVPSLNPDAVAVRLDRGRLPFTAFDEKRIANKLAACQVMLQPLDARALRCENAPTVGDQNPLPAHPLRDFHLWLKERLEPRSPSTPGSDFATLDGFPGLDDKPVILHISMDWGGGVNKWVTDYARSDPHSHHLVLVSQGEFFRQRFGETLSLRWGHAGGPELQRFELSDPIAVMADEHAEYEAVLDSIIKGFGVGKLLVSSLIGHGTACLRTGLPTVRVFHDYFPHWPLLDARLDGRKPSAQALQAALQASGDEAFGGINAGQHQQWHQALLSAYRSKSVALVAPSHSVVSNLKALGVPGSRKKLHVIPHAVAPLRVDIPQDTSGFTVLVPGRVNAVKGQEILEQLAAQWDEKMPDARLVLLGAGRQGRLLAEKYGLEIIENYLPDELPEWLRKLAPQAALLLSRAAETYSYTLSEMQQAGIPVIASRIGALAERIDDGETGLLVSPGPASEQAEQVFKHLKALREDPEKRARLAHNSRRLAQPTFAEMQQAYEKIWRHIGPVQPDMLVSHDSPRVLWPRYGQRQLAEYAVRLNRHIHELQQRLQASEILVEERTRWARQLEEFAEELKQAIAALKIHRQELEDTIAEREKHIAAEQAEVARLKQLVATEQQRLTGEIEELKGEMGALQRELTEVYASTSWRITKPLRFARRLLQGGSRRLAYRARQAAGLPLRFSRSVRTRGLKNTLGLIHQRLHGTGAQVDQKAAAQETVVLERIFSPVSIATSGQPRVSVIVPVFNHFAHTWNCLNSIARLDTDVPFEVIVVDDASTDETAEKIGLIDGIRYHRQPENGGFIEACNTGAALAQGEFLLFLNNDTVVQPRWLDALVATFQQYDDAGLVGSQLRYPDGRLQEAGGIVFNDASGWNYGRLGDPQAPEFNHLRAVDYCSGASILIRKPLFEQLGGFDTRYKPAYYEDTDLAFAVRQAGYQVYYQPESVVVHFEGVSSGTDITSGTKRYQAINQKKFAEKWAEALPRQPAPGTDIELCRIHGQPPRVLIADATTPTPDQDSGSMRMINLIRILRNKGYHVVFMPENLSHAGDYTRRLQQMGVECLYHPAIRNPLDYLKPKGRHLDAVILSRYYVAEPLLPLVRHYAPQARVIFDTVDLHYVREQRQAELEGSDKLARLAGKTRLREQACIKQADITWVVSPFEQQLLAKELPDSRVEILSNIHDIPGCRRPFEQRRDILFVGGFQHTPNVDAVTWFVHDIWPLIRQQLPEVRFHLVGSKAPEAVRALGDAEGVVFHGFVPDIEPLLDGCRMAVAPLRFGAGVKGKVNLSMAHGLPVVATATATEGMQTEHGVDVLNADTPEAFAAAVVRLYNDAELWRRLSGNGVENVRRWFSFETASRRIEQTLDEEANTAQFSG